MTRYWLGYLVCTESSDWGEEGQQAIMGAIENTEEEAKAFMQYRIPGTWRIQEIIEFSTPGFIWHLKTGNIGM